MKLKNIILMIFSSFLLFGCISYSKEYNPEHNQNLYHDPQSILTQETIEKLNYYNGSTKAPLGVIIIDKDEKVDAEDQQELASFYRTKWSRETNFNKSDSKILIIDPNNSKAFFNQEFFISLFTNRFDTSYERAKEKLAENDFNGAIMTYISEASNDKKETQQISNADSSSNSDSSSSRLSDFFSKAMMWLLLFSLAGLGASILYAVGKYGQDLAIKSESKPKPTSPIKKSFVECWSTEDIDKIEKELSSSSDENSRRATLKDKKDTKVSKPLSHKEWAKLEKERKANYYKNKK